MFGRKCLVRRTLQSSIPFEGGKVIGDAIPPFEHWVIESKFTEGEKALYDKRTPPLHRGLLIRQRDTGNICWNIKKYRHVALITTWSWFHHVHSSIEARHMVKAVKKAHDK
ncbi:hypothetical protein GX50_00910 [[Emmonsia] crescens]|uniref:Uncharacterized protein n=1 Tax=[Emmonsia] crescens TaxID=73230 RepID=A0A2B7ZQF0_9EURO|nr:hypothetical protein GX50_00910 [Emmonsia crescens]